MGFVGSILVRSVKEILVQMGIFLVPNGRFLAMTTGFFGPKWEAFWFQVFFLYSPAFLFTVLGTVKRKPEKTRRIHVSSLLATLAHDMMQGVLILLL